VTGLEARPGTELRLLRLGDDGGSRTAPLRNSPAREGVGPGQSGILVVEDESDALDSIVELLETEGYRAVGAHNGQEALDALRAGLRPALILLDLKMPVMDGWDFCNVLSADRDLSEIPIAIVTASASLPSLPARRKDAGFFVKPINFDRLLRTVRQICG
jgi:CheY-like chemotaxis protein